MFNVYCIVFIINFYDMINTLQCVYLSFYIFYICLNFYIFFKNIQIIVYLYSKCKTDYNIKYEQLNSYR